MNEYVYNIEDKKMRKPFNLYQIQLKGLEKGDQPLNMTHMIKYMVENVITSSNEKNMGLFRFLCPMEDYCPYKNNKECLQCYDSSQYITYVQMEVIPTQVRVS